MDHQAAQELFSDYLEGELSPREREELSAHLQECEACREELEDLKKTMRSLSGLKALPPPAGFASKVQQKIRKRSRGRFFTPERLLMRIPFEWISFIIIMIMLAMYLLMMMAQSPMVQRDSKQPRPSSASRSRRPSRSRRQRGGRHPPAASVDPDARPRFKKKKCLPVGERNLYCPGSLQ